MRGKGRRLCYDSDSSESSCSSSRSSDHECKEDEEESKSLADAEDDEYLCRLLAQTQRKRSTFTSLTCSIPSRSRMTKEEPQKRLSNHLMDALLTEEDTSVLDDFSEDELESITEPEHNRTVLHLSLLCDNLSLTRAIIEKLILTPMHRKKQAARIRVRGELFERKRLMLYSSREDDRALERREMKTVEEQLVLEAERKFVRLVSKPDRDGWTAIHFAAQGRSESMSTLLQAAPDLKRTKLPSRLRDQLLETRKETVSCRDSTGCTPLHIAAANGNYQAVHELLKWGADRYARNLDGETPMDLAPEHVTRRALSRGLVVDICKGRSDAIETFSTRLFLDESMCEEGRDGINNRGTLHEACRGGSLELVKLLVNKGNVDVNVRDASGWSPLHYCAQSLSRQVAQFLIENGADVNAKSYAGLTALHIVCNIQTNSVEQVRPFVEMLLRHGAALEAKSELGFTPLLRASKKGLSHLVELFILKGADKYSTNDKGDNALHIACFNGHTETAKVLCFLDAEFSHLKRMKNKAGKRPEELVTKEGRLVTKHSISVLDTVWEVACKGELDKLRWTIRRMRSVDGTSSGLNVKTHWCGFTPLHAAVLGSDMFTISKDWKRLFADESKSKGGIKMSGSGRYSRNKRQALKIVEFLLAQKEVYIDASDHRGCTALMYACMLGKEDIASYLIARGADCQLADNNGNIALHYIYAFKKPHVLGLAHHFDETSLNFDGKSGEDVAGELSSFSFPELKETKTPTAKSASADVSRDEVESESKDDDIDQGTSQTATKTLQEIAMQVESEEQTGLTLQAIADEESRQAEKSGRVGSTLARIAREVS